MLKQLRGFSSRLSKDGWLLAAILILGGLCLLSGGMSDAPSSLTDEESRLSRILSALEGAGHVEVAVFHASDDEAAQPCGVVVVAEGADNAAVQLRLSRAVTTLLGVDAAQIEIFKLKEEQ